MIWFIGIAVVVWGVINYPVLAVPAVICAIWKWLESQER